MAGILVYALHDDEGNFNKNSLGALSEAAKLAGELGTEAAAVVVGDVADDAAAGLGKYGVSKVYRAKEAPEGLAQPIVDVMAKVMQDNDFDYALFGGGLLGFEIGAGLTARLNAGVTMEVTQVNVQDGKLVAERPILQDSQIADVGYVDEPGIIIGRLNAFDTNESGRNRRGRGRPGRALRVVDQGEDGDARRAARRRRQHRGRQDPGRRRPRPGQEGELRARRAAGRLDGRRRGGHPRRRGCGLVPVRGPDRPDRQDRRAEPLPGARDLRRDPAQGRHAELGEHPGHQQGPERADLRVLGPRRGGRPAQDRPQADRGDQGQEEPGLPAARYESGAVPSRSSSRRRSSRRRSS